jgi:RNA polymerase sigma factor (sigma-70 family)
MFPFFHSANVSSPSQSCKEITGDPEGEEKLLAMQPKPARTNCISSSNLEAVPEEHLLSVAREGDQAAYGEMCKRHSKKILRVTLRITRNHEDAEDALQECFLKAMIHIRDFDGNSQFSTWLTRIAINAALMKIRQKRKYRESSIQSTADFREEPQLIELPDHSLNPEEIYSEREQAMILREALCALRPRIRTAIEICHLQEQSLTETSRRLGISVAATKGRVFHAKAALRKSRILKRIVSAKVQRAA